jgi:hypothetical protein
MSPEGSAFPMKLRSQIALLTLSLLLSSAAAFAQPAAPAQILPSEDLSLRFSRDGSLLRVIGRSPSAPGQLQHVRAVTYAAQTGAVVHIVDLQPDTDVDSITSDGATAIVTTSTSTENISASHENEGLFLLDTATGKLQAVPRSWYGPDSDWDAAISGDGRLVSIYSETDSPTPMTVTVYDWPAKTHVATRTSEYVAAGGSMDGSVTEDGEVEFDGNRVGSTIVNLKTGRVMAQFGPSSVRSPNGAWAVQFPNLSWDESSSKRVLVKNGKTGLTLGKLAVQVTDTELYGQFSGAFCGNTARFIMVSDSAVAAYALPSGKLLASLPASDWRDASATDIASPSVACSPSGTRVAILSGTRLTFHDLK